MAGTVVGIVREVRSKQLCFKYHVVGENENFDYMWVSALSDASVTWGEICCDDDEMMMMMMIMMTTTILLSFHHHMQTLIWRKQRQNHCVRPLVTLLRWPKVCLKILFYQMDRSGRETGVEFEVVTVTVDNDP